MVCILNEGASESTLFQEILNLKTLYTNILCIVILTKKLGDIILVVHSTSTQSTDLSNNALSTVYKNQQVSIWIKISYILVH